jgi:hypothetical protein
MQQTKRVDGKALECSCVIDVRFAGERCCSTDTREGSLRRLYPSLITALLTFSAQAAFAGCEAYWLRLEGKDERQVLEIPHGFPLLHFARNEPRWQPPRYGLGGEVIEPASTSELLWRPLAGLASLKFVGHLEGRRVYLASYSPYSIAVLAEEKDWLFCPALVLDADAGFRAGQVVAALGSPEIFRWNDHDILSLRIYFRGSGSIQESVFLSVVDGRVVFLEQDPFVDQLHALGWQLETRGGGFCRGTLRWSRLAYKEDPVHGIVQGEVSIVYSVTARRLAIASLSVITGDELKRTEPCQILYE